MNHIIKLIIATCCLGSICTSCSQQEEETYIPSEGEVSFTSSINASSRATATSFEADDAISVFAFKGSGTSGFASESYAANKKYIYQNNRFAASDKENAIIYPTGEEALSFQAIYPYSASAGSSFVFNVNEDQSLGSNYTLSDLMTASVAATTDASPNLRFSHRLTNVVFTLSFDVAPAGTTQVTFQNVQKAATVDMLTGTFSATGEKSNVKAAVNGINSYKVILPPQTIEAEAAVAVITTETGEVYTWKMPKGAVWKSGIQYTYTLHIGEKGDVTFTSEIDPWGEPKSKRLSQIVRSDNRVTTLTYEGQKLVSYSENSSIDERLCQITYTENQITLSVTERSLDKPEEIMNETMTVTLDAQGYATSGIRSDGEEANDWNFTYTDGYLTKIQENKGSWNMAYTNGNIDSFRNFTCISNNNLNKAGIIFPDNNWLYDFILEALYYTGATGKATRNLVEEVEGDLNGDGQIQANETSHMTYTLDEEGYPIVITKIEYGGTTYTYRLTYIDLN